MTSQTDRSAGVIGNLAFKAPVRVATTASITLSGLQTIDGIVLVAGDRVLAKDQSNPVQNGIWVSDTGDWERAKDCDGQYDLVEGSLIRVNHGTANVGTFWACSTTGTITPGSSSITFVPQTSAIAGVTAVGLAVITAANAAAARTAIDSPSNAEAILDVIFANKGDLIGASANDTPLLVAAGTDGQILMQDSSAASGLVWQTYYPRSMAPNPFVQIDQRVNSATSVADDVYCVDRYYVLTQTGAIAVTRQTDQENGQPSNARLGQSQASAQRMGLATILESTECKHLRGQTVTFRPRVRISNSQAVRIAVLEWTGTADAVTSDVVNDWTSSDYTDGAAKFFVDANYTPSGTGSKTPSAATWTDMDGLTVTLGSTFNNLVLFVWTEGTAAQNVTLDVGKMRFVRGSYAGEIELPDRTSELLRCMRHFIMLERDFSVINDLFVGTGLTISTSQAAIYGRYPVPMRHTGSSQVLLISAAADFKLIGGTVSSAVTALSVNGTPLGSDNGFHLLATGTATPYTASEPAVLTMITGSGKFIAFSAEL